MSPSNKQNKINVGVDVGKSQLDIYIRPLDIYFTVSNDPSGIRQAIKQLKSYHLERITVEATGRLEHAFVYACSKAGLPFTIANPAHVKKFAGAIGRQAKTDKLDAQLIAHYGEAIQPSLSDLKPDAIQAMSDLLSRRGQMIKMQTMEKNRLQIMPKKLHSSIKPLLNFLKKEIEKLDSKLLKIIEECTDYKNKHDIIKSVPGMGNVATLSVISNLPELGYITNKEASSLVGVAPMNQESGRYKGHRKIKGGRYQVRTVLFMAMMSAIQCNPIFKAKYESLVKAGKPKKVALIACMRKLVIILNSMVRDGTYWNQNHA